MKRSPAVVVVVANAFVLASLVGCEEKPKTVGDSMKDAGDNVNRAADHAGDTMNKAGDRVKDATHDAADNARDAAK